VLAEHLLPLDWPIQHIHCVDVPGWLHKQVVNGVRLPAERIASAKETAEGQIVRIYLHGQFWGMAAREGDALVWKCQTPPEQPISNAKEEHHEDRP